MPYPPILVMEFEDVSVGSREDDRDTRLSGLQQSGRTTASDQIAVLGKFVMPSAVARWTPLRQQPEASELDQILTAHNEQGPGGLESSVRGEALGPAFDVPIVQKVGVGAVARHDTFPDRVEHHGTTVGSLTPRSCPILKQSMPTLLHRLLLCRLHDPTRVLRTMREESFMDRSPLSQGPAVESGAPSPNSLPYTALMSWGSIDERSP